MTYSHILPAKVFLSCLTIALSLSCSRPVTCALEGCNKNSLVVLASDLNGTAPEAAQEADAVAAEKADFDKDIEDIKMRLTINEALSDLLSKTVQLHEQRLTNLETKTGDLSSALDSLNQSILKAQTNLEETNKKLVDLDSRTRAQLDQLADQQQQDKMQSQEQIDQLTITLRQEIAAGDSELQTKINGLLNDMATERARVDSADAAIKADAESKLASLRAELMSRIEVLQSDAAAAALATAQKIETLDEKIQNLVAADVALAIQLSTQINALQLQLDSAESLNNGRYTQVIDQIAELRTKLASELDRLDLNDAGIKGQIDALSLQQGLFLDDLAQLNNRALALETFKTQQAVSNAGFNSSLQLLTTNISDLQTRATNIESNMTTIASSIRALSLAVANLRADMLATKQAQDLLNAMFATKADLSILTSKVSSLELELNQSITDINDDIASLRALVSTYSYCELGAIERLGHGHNAQYYQRVTCDGTQIKVLVLP